MAAPFRPRPPRPACQFCGQDLEDPMLAFLDHVAERPACRAAWDEWKASVRREASGT